VPFLIGWGMGLVLVPLTGPLGRATGLVARPGHPLRIHAESVPVLGGVAVTAAALGAAAIVGHVPSPAVLGATLAALITGLLDDARTLHPVLRLAALVVAGVLLATEGMPEGGRGLAAGAAVVLLVVACTNAVNITDGQDGLAGGLTSIAAASLGVLALVKELPSTVALSLALAGASGAFLLWNRPPARIFLGNGGAYAVGTLLAALVIPIIAVDGWRGLLAAGACLGVFGFELVLTMTRRLSARRPLTTGDRLHSYDVVAERWGRGRSTLLFWGLGAVAGSAGVAIGLLPLPAAGILAGVGFVGSVGLGAYLWPRLGEV